MPTSTTAPAKASVKRSAGKQQVFHWQDIAKHNRPEDAWVICNDKVYDITEWIGKHPGGRDVLHLAAGRDVTQLVESYHTRVDKVWQVLKQVALVAGRKYEIGVCVDRELPVFPKRGPFFETLKQRLDAYFHQTGQDPQFHVMMLVRYAFIFALIAGTYYLQFFHPVVSRSVLASTLCAVLLGLGCALVGLHPLHDASHCSITRNPWVWRLAGAAHDFINGCSFLAWCYQHPMGHHPYTNISGADPDISTQDPDFRRIKATQPWYRRYLGQHSYVPLLYGLLGLKFRMEDITILFLYGTSDQIRCNPVEGWHFWVFWLGKAFFVTYRFVIPLMFSALSWQRVLYQFVVSELMASYWLAFTFQSSHVVEDVEWPVPNSDKLVDMDWAVMQVVTAQDYSHKSWFWTNFAGALNFQVVHHLFPNISQHYYPEIAPIVIETCKDFQIRYLIKDTFFDAFYSHLSHLKKLGMNEDAKSR